MDNSGKEAEAMALLAEAERKVKNSQSFFSGLFGGSSKIEEACEIYARAANMFKMAKNWSAAGNAFCQAAQLHLQLQSKHDAATCFVDAGNAFKKADPQEAINCLMRAIEIYTDMGRFTIAAKHHISIAEIYETELVDIEKAIAHYEQSADYYKGEESNSSANKCLLKVAGYAALLEQYQKAIDIYEQVGTNAMDSPLLKYSAKDYFFKAALCHFCIDMLNAKLAVQKYEELFPAFSDSRECKLMKVKVARGPRGAECGQLHRVGEWPAWGSGPFTGMGPLGKPPFLDMLSPDIHPFLSGPQPTVNFFLQSPQKPHK
ncbi:PREDICTED: alpha-soluble NSF attachment protein isoform X1 [Mandrillus leucophaeus]|uniref:alpha-soluble NSF attachment protein isoform X1 n=1 Tax=Mandrillus leucophaeus TaxID=9568 RepID=UPI0005F36384|nr:PREDICTED: alpha-soluble NSF attachment protein isoform X1 [Mandrillus leucophaeus]